MTSPIAHRNTDSGSWAAIAAFFALAVAVLVAASPASADSRIGGATGDGPGDLSQPAGLAVSKQQNGAVYVLEGGENQRVSEFSSNGAFIRAFGWGIVPGAASGFGDLVAGTPAVTGVQTTSGAFIHGEAITGAGIPPGTVVQSVNAGEIVLSQNASSSGTAVPLTVAPGPGNVPVNERQRLVVTATGGQFTISFTSPKPDSTTATTPSLPFDVPAAGSGSLEEALEGLPNLGAGNVSVSGGPGDSEGSHPYLIEFTGRYADVNVRHLTVESTLSGGVPSSGAALTTVREGGGALETCTTVCTGENHGELGSEGTGVGSEPGQMRWSDEIAIDNDPASGSYGDVYVLDQRNFRIEKYDPEGHFLLTFGGEVDKTTGADVCTAADLTGGDVCGQAVPGTTAGRFYKEEPETVAGGSKSWAHAGANSIAVGPGGTVYVGDYGRVQEFNPEGEFTGELTLPDSEPQFVSALAVDASGNVYERSATYAAGGAPLKSQVAGIREYSPAHALLRTFATEAGSTPFRVAVGENGNVFASDAGAGKVIVFKAFKPSGQLYAEFTSPQVDVAGFPQWSKPAGIALNDGTGSFYASAIFPLPNHIAVIPLPQAGPPAVESEEATDIEPGTATLHVIVNPREFDTHYRFQWVTQKHFEEEGFANPEQSAPVDLGSVWRINRIQTALSGLATGTRYHWRVLAESHCNESEPSEVCETKPEATFDTLPAVSVRDFTTQTVGPEEVTIKAELNPNNSIQATHWEICYGPAEGDYSDGCASGELQVHGNQFEKITATFKSLNPNTPYHYVLRAENEYTSPGHPLEAPDVFTTEPSSAEERQAEDCPANGTVHGEVRSTLREQNNSLALSDCRAYEQVTPPDKKGGEAANGQLSPSGEAVSFAAPTDIGGSVLDPLLASYLSMRGAGGWTTQPLISHLPPAGYQFLTFAGLDPPIASAGLDSWLYTERPGVNVDDAEYHATTTYLSLGMSDGSYIPHASPELELLEWNEEEMGYPTVPRTLQVNAVAEDFSRIFISTDERLLPAPADPRSSDEANQGFPTRIYEVAGAGGASPTLSLVAEVPPGLSGKPSVGCAISAINTEHGNLSTNPLHARPANADGSTLAYTVPIEHAPGTNCGSGTSNPIGLFVRTVGGPPHQLNTPPPSQCSGPSLCASGAVATPTYYGMSPDGSRVWFTTAQPLINADKDTTNDLYLAKLENGQLSELVLASAGDATDPTPGEGAGVRGVTEISPDGSHAAFVATGVLTTAPNAAGESAASGADNLYVYDAASAQTKFVARLCSGPEKSGSSADPACPADLSEVEASPGTAANNDSELWVAKPHEAQFTPDGRYLLFAGYGRLAPGDTDGVRDLYRYDFQSGEIERVTSGRNGNDGNGNDDLFPVGIPSRESTAPSEFAADKNRAISSDGSVVVFGTSAPLVSGDTNKANDIYEWEEGGHGTCGESGGCIRLISSGLAPQGDQRGIVSASGRDIIFQTRRDHLVNADTDGVADIYDAREGGGFPPPPPPPPCFEGGSAETCHGEGTKPSLPINPATEGTGHGPEGEHLRCAKGKRRVRKHGQVRCVPKRSHHKRHRRTNSNRGGSK